MQSWYSHITISNIYLDTVPDESCRTKIQKVQRFAQVYHTNSYQIICHLIIKQKGQ